LSALPAAVAASGAHPARGILLMVATVCSFASMEAIVKWLSQSYPVPMITWARYLVQVLLLLAVFWPRMGPRILVTRRPWMQALRGALLGMASLTFFTGLAGIPLAEATAISSIGPILVTVFAVLLLGEKAPAGTAWALAASFCGVLLIVRPGSSVFAWSALLPLASAFCYAGYQLLTRRLAGVDDGNATLLLGALVATGALSLAVPFHWATPRNLIDLGLLVATGAIGALGHFTLVRALECAPATLLAPFSYLHLVVSLFLGLLVFGTFPDGIALAGIGMIVASGIVMLVRSRRVADPVED
jgi:drug/metabolite transporter (DMT)-like permease